MNHASIPRTPAQMAADFERWLRDTGQHPEQHAARKAKAKVKRKAAKAARRANRS